MKARVFHSQTWASKPHSPFTRVHKFVLKGALLVPLPIDSAATESLYRAVVLMTSWDRSMGDSA